MNNAQLAAVLDRVADLLEFQGANPFRVRAYRSGARAVKNLAEPVLSILEDETRKLTDIAGIGKDLAEKIATLASTGRLPMLDDLLKEIPPSVLALLRIPGLGPKKAAVLCRELKITSLDELGQACREGRVRDLKGFGEKTEKMILEGLEFASKADDRIYWADADLVVTELLDHMRALPDIHQMEIAGSYRRGRETVRDLDLLVDSNDPDRIMDRFGDFPSVAKVIARGETKMAIRLDSGLQIDLRVVPTESFGAALQYFTGSKDHNVVVRSKAKSRGLKINEWGVYRRHENQPDEWIAGRTEQEVYAALDLPCFPPELREARQEFDWAEADGLPRLVELTDIQGDLHMHTTESDGQASLEDMVAAALERNLKYIAITDHSKRVTMARGLDGDRLRKQWKLIDTLNQRGLGITVLKGVECDILERGGMDLPDDVLAEADWVVASIHYGQNQPQEQITARIMEAIRHPSVSAIAHPTGRLINRRKSYEIDLDAVLRNAREYGKLVELNANPARLDLDDVACAAAKRHGVRIVINTDAHRVEGLDVMRYGILQARRAGLTKQDVANTGSWDQLKQLVGNPSS